MTKDSDESDHQEVEEKISNSGQGAVQEDSGPESMKMPGDGEKGDSRMTNPAAETEETKSDTKEKTSGGISDLSPVKSAEKNDQELLDEDTTGDESLKVVELCETGSGGLEECSANPSLQVEPAILEKGDGQEINTSEDTLTDASLGAPAENVLPAENSTSDPLLPSQDDFENCDSPTVPTESPAKGSPIPELTLAPISPEQSKQNSNVEGSPALANRNVSPAREDDTTTTPETEASATGAPEASDLLPSATPSLLAAPAMAASISDHPGAECGSPMADASRNDSSVKEEDRSIHPETEASATGALEASDPSPSAMPSLLSDSAMAVSIRDHSGGACGSPMAYASRNDSSVKEDDTTIHPDTEASATGVPETSDPSPSAIPSFLTAPAMAAASRDSPAVAASSSTPASSRDRPFRPSAPEPSSNCHQQPPQKSYDYLLKVLLVGDSDVGKQEIISNLEDGINDSPFCSSEGAAYKTTIILIDGKRVKLQLWDTSGQGRFCTIIRSYSRGAQGILLVYDITNKWSFEGISRWLHEVDHYAPGIPKVLVGNRLHLAFKRQVHQEEAEEYAEKNSMGFIEVSPLVNFNISETFVELARMALKRNGMERLWRSNKVSTLYEMCAVSIVNTTTVYDIDRLPLPSSVKQNLKSYAVTNYSISQANQKYLRRPGSVALHRSKSQKAGGGHKRTFSSGSADVCSGSSGVNSLKAALTPSALLRRRLRHRHHLANTPADAANVSCGPSTKGCVIS